MCAFLRKGKTLSRHSGLRRTMRLAPLLSLALLAASAPVLAHESHGSCPRSTTLVGTVVHVDLYVNDCVGATVTVPHAACPLDDMHPLPGVHAPLLHGNNCETGVLVEAPTLLP